MVVVGYGMRQALNWPMSFEGSRILLLNNNVNLGLLGYH